MSWASCRCRRPAPKGALLDRLTHHVHILEMNGDSYRRKSSKQKRAAERAK
jgi:DNA replication protein DnaC